MTQRRAFMVVGLAYGDCGKGGIVDFLARDCGARLVIRFNGGPQAGHNVVTPDGRHHTFSQFGSGAFVPDVRTLLAQHTLVEPYALLNEAQHLASLGVHGALARLTIDRRCVVITPPQQAANRLRELARGAAAHGTCGVGVGEAASDAIAHRQETLYAGELADADTVRDKLRAAAERKYRELSPIARMLRDDPRAAADIAVFGDTRWVDAAIENYAAVAQRAQIVHPAQAFSMVAESETTIFEGAQGVLLDESFGFHPHTTWTDTTFANADALLAQAGLKGDVTRIGVLRTYSTRHGPGPLVTEEPQLRPMLDEPHNAAAGWQGAFRVGLFDAVAVRYALRILGKVDCLAVTHLDRLAALPPRWCTRYQLDSAPRAAADLFEMKDGAITDIRIDRPANLARQERLTEYLLKHCRPLYSDAVPRDPEGWMDHLSRELAVPIAIASSGPSAAAKRWRETARIHL